MITGVPQTRTAAVPLRIVAAALAFFVLSAATAKAAGSEKTRGFASALTAKSGKAENYDIRDDESVAAKEKVDRHKDKVAKERKEKIREKKEKIHQAAAQLQREIPGLEVAFSKHTGGPEIVGTSRGRQKLGARSNEKRDKVARNFLKKNADLYGLSVPEAAQLDDVADYSNPAGNLSWVELKQEVNDLPVFRGEIRFAFNADGELVRTVGNLVPALEDYKKSDNALLVPAAEAVRIAAESIGVPISGNPILKSVNNDATEYVFAGGTFVDDIKVRLEYFPLDTGVLTLAWSMILWQEHDAFYTYVGGEAGELLFRKNIVEEQVQPATYGVYDNDSPAPGSPTAARPGLGLQEPQIPRASVIRIHEHPSFNDPWMPDGTSITTGNNVDAGLDLATPNGIDAGTRPTGTPAGSRVFDYLYNPGPGIPPPGESPTLANYRNGEVTHMFFWTNRYHDRLYELGFTEAARNFQQNNFGRGGVGNDRVLAEGQDSSGTNNANFATPPDGGSGRMQMFIFTGPTPDRTSALDNDVLLHELTHGTSNRLHANASGLVSTMARGMGEGWSDYYARAVLSGPDEDVNAVFATGGWVTYLIDGPTFVDNYYYGIRRFPYAVKSALGPNGKPFNPITFADLDPTQINLSDGAYPPAFIGTPFQVHNIGEIWCSSLLEVRARLITRVGHATGNRLALQLTTDGMKLDPVDPTLVQGRNAILAANFASSDAAAELDIWRGFATRGVGFSASAISAANSSVVEAFDLPFAIGNITVVGDSCDSSATVDPGETVTISVPVTNSFQLNTVNDVTVSLVGDGTASYGSLAPGQSATRDFTFVVPGDAACGTKITLTFNIVSSLGSDTKTVELQVGTPTGVVPAGSSSSGNVAAPINDFATVDVPITVTGTGIVGDVNVSVRLNHTFDGDLTISLVAPDGKVVALSNGRGGAGDNFGTGANDCSGTPTTFDDEAATAISGGVAPFTGTFRPDSPLAAMKGRQMNGIWKLRVSDGFGLDTGTVGCATLQLDQQLYFCCGVAGTPIIKAAPPATLVAECGNASNGGVDPGEVVTMNFPLRNVGTGLTTDLVATLESSGGITAISGPQSYGVVSPIGPPVSRPFTFAVSSLIACGDNAVATLHLTDGALDLGSVTFNIKTGTVVQNTHAFSNPASIIIPATGTGASTGAPSTPYPSTITVSGASGTVQSVKISLLGFNHTFPSDVDVLLVGPGGQKFIAMSDAGGSVDAINVDITLDDAAAAAVPTILLSGTFRPTNVSTGDLFPAPAPAAPYASPATAGTATFASTFGGTNPNGTWSLYVVDDAGADAGRFAGGWTLTLGTAESVCAVVPPPTITGESVNRPELWPPNHKMEDVVVSYAVDCGSCSLSVSSNEPADGTGDGDTSPDWEVIDSHNVRLRAERSGSGNGRIYTITISCFNGTATTERTVTVRVPLSQGGGNASLTSGYAFGWTAPFILTSSISFE